MDVGSIILGGGVGSVLLAIVNAVINRRKLGADTVRVLSKAAIDLVQPLQERIHELENEVERLRARVAQTVDQLDACQASNRSKDAQIAALIRQKGITP